MGACDGNNSLKSFLRTRGQADTRTFESDYFLSHDFVDQFKDEVKRKVRKPDVAEACVPQIPSLKLPIYFIQGEVEVEGDPTDGQTGPATCTDRWRAANADTLKGMYNAFAETGVFVSVCRHGLVWTVLDMMRSGEL